LTFDENYLVLTSMAESKREGMMNKEGKKMIALRSDTVTQPTDAMRQAAANAVLGDDVFGEDPTVERLETMAAQLMGKDSALFVASGTMGNSICVLTSCGRGDEVILGDVSHIVLNEVGNIAGLGGIHPRTIPNQIDGTLKLEDIESVIRGEDIHWPRTRMVCLENTHNRCFGAVLTPEYMASVRALCEKHGIIIHLDGARIFNAAVALNLDAKEFTRHVDTVSFCLSKGLAAPIGSVVCGTREFIAEARRTRKMLGGGMRQVGIIAAPGVVALETMITRLQKDHENARLLAKGIDGIPGLRIEIQRVRTNIVYFDIEDAKIQSDEFLSQLETHGVRILQTGEKRYRCVTHYGIERFDIENALDVLRLVMKNIISK
jgi:threonine aldolase